MLYKSHLISTYAGLYSIRYYLHITLDLFTRNKEYYQQNTLGAHCEPPVLPQDNMSSTHWYFYLDIRSNALFIRSITNSCTDQSSQRDQSGTYFSNVTSGQW